jgi:uncharacterized protein YecE (DUF72 family)
LSVARGLHQHPDLGVAPGDFVYARLQRSVDEQTTGYSVDAIDDWAQRARVWSAGGVPEGLPTIATDEHGKTARQSKPVYLFFISGAKHRNPAAAEALIDRLKK